ncbi:uncharacterized protein LOC131064643 isoform X2 [Cryptomeria japonica]|uniref:uncharacterized protein LOC131064643 isoform X2 n=1 Tax=Cryptomeria japonica TaxID=3369 RepID=UPI0027DA6A18|nr:uncharacterized protein LOC131064643 isoform X2 [Cryptomeria japonica]
MDLVYRCHFTTSSMVWRRRWKGMCHCCAGVELNRKKQVVFMGSPTVAANALDKLLDASHSESSIFDETFLANMRELKPDLCVTAAYGNILPNRFLEIPKHGTVNIHPSLLPLYRGAAPVQRALQDGVQVTGVSVAFTVRALDAGPIIASESLEIDNSVKAPELLAVLFDRGVHILLRELPSILNGSAASKALEQDESMASLAPKVSTGESWLCFDQPALTLHNKVRAFAGWPGTRTKVEIHDHTTNETQIIEVKIITTKVGSKDCHDEHINSKDPILLDGDALIFCCGGGSTLEVLELQPPGKKPMRARDFWNGLRGRKLFEA